MKTRTITGLAYALLAVTALLLIRSPMLLCLIVGFSVLAAHEICHAAQIENKALIAVSMIVAGIVPPMLEYWTLIRARIHIPAYPLLLGYGIVLLALMLAQFEKTRFVHVFFALFASLALPGALTCIVLLRDSMPDKNLAVWLVFFVMCSAWLTDVFALFTGVKLGKHKMAPRVSPKKTWEGAVGGVAGSTLVNIGFALLFNHFFLENYRINLLAVVVLSLLVGAASMVGDLAASVLKRNYGVKDFGKFFPGHGGVMDRFDSLLLAAPFLYALVQLEQSLGLHLLYEVIS